MKTAIKILILLLAVTAAIGGVMVYAKTKVTPPVALRQINQYEIDIQSLVSEVSKAKDAKSEDELFAKGFDRIHVFYQEGKMDATITDKSLDKIVGSYSPKFMKRCFASFSQSDWRNDTHNYILSQSAFLKKIAHTDETNVITKSTSDSLLLISTIIGDFRDAKRISRISTFTSYENARSAISKARTYAKNPYLSNCRTLVNNLNVVRNRLAKSCYNQVLSKVDELGKYRFYTKDYYDNTLVPQVDKIVTNYDNKAAAIFGSKENVNALWNRAKSHYNDAMSYYEDDL